MDTRCINVSVDKCYILSIYTFKGAIVCKQQQNSAQIQQSRNFGSIKKQEAQLK